MKKIKLGEIHFDKKDNPILKNYSYLCTSELFISISYFIGLGLEEFCKNKLKGIPEWCFENLFGALIQEN